MKEETPTDKDKVHNSEIVEALGNMFLVKIDGELEQVPATYKNELLYKHELYELLHPDEDDERVILTDSKQSDKFVAVAPTDNDSVYQIWVDDNPYPVMNPPSMAEDVLRGIRDALESPADYTRLYELYREIRSTRVRRSVMEKATSLFPRNEVIPEEQGWNILGIFLLTWDARVFLNTGDVDEQEAYRVSGSGVSETDEAKEFLQLAIRDNVLEQFRGMNLEISTQVPNEVDTTNCSKIEKECPTCGTDSVYEYYEDGEDDVEQRAKYICSNTSCAQAWEEYSLTEREIEFISKAKWLVNHRNQLDDDAFWDVIESYVWHSST